MTEHLYSIGRYPHRFEKRNSERDYNLKSQKNANLLNPVRQGGTEKQCLNFTCILYLTCKFERILLTIRSKGHSSNTWNNLVSKAVIL